MEGVPEFVLGPEREGAAAADFLDGTDHRTAPEPVDLDHETE